MMNKKKIGLICCAAGLKRVLRPGPGPLFESDYIKAASPRSNPFYAENPPIAAPIFAIYAAVTAGPSRAPRS
jgi:hypothetical protein